jgi:hypothetical protein
MPARAAEGNVGRVFRNGESLNLWTARSVPDALGRARQRRLPLLHDLGVGALDERAQPRERLAAPVAQLGDPCVDQLGRRPGFLRSAHLHDALLIPRRSRRPRAATSAAPD